ncbi:hypothetical protein FACS1894170_01360 [Planctomycetales bacterium]|nr:hypothetical protein FACS1894170_01360 [Planctomycetales bacterium]
MKIEVNSNRYNQSDNENGIAVAEDLLLGYLCRALDETERCRVEREIQQHPFLNTKLATLQKKLTPLELLKSRTVLPPQQLAKRTCAKVWDTVDSTEAKARPLAAPLRLYDENKPQRRKNRWIGFVASVTLGMFLAFMIAPFLHLVKHSVVNTVRDNQRNAINERINPYEQINAPQPTADVVQETPLNLGRFAWKELHPNTLLTPVGNGAFAPVGVQQAAQSFSGDTILERTPHFRNMRPVFWDTADVPLPFRQRSISDDILLTTPQGVQTGSGQDVLFKDGRIFFRDLPR